MFDVLRGLALQVPEGDVHGSFTFHQADFWSRMFMLCSCRFRQAEYMKYVQAPRSFPLLALGCLTVALIAATVPAAQGDDWRDLHGEVRAGRLVALPSVLDWLEAHYDGEVLEVEMERDDGLTRYEIEMIGPQGQLVEFEFDATSGELIGIEGINIENMRRR